MSEKGFSKFLSLFLTFLKIGAFTFGGGYAMIPLIQREAVDNKKWVSDEDILEIVAIAESTPGPIAINAATFIGYKVGGFFGAFFAVLGVVLPSFIMILIISLILSEFQNITAVKYAFFGIRAGVAALLIRAVWTMYKKVRKNAFSFIMMGLAFLFVAFLNIPVLTVIIFAIISGLLFTLAIRRETK